jgi:hypothetical protein
MADKALEAQSNNINTFTELETRDMDEVNILILLLTFVRYLNFLPFCLLGTISVVFVLVQS